MITASADFLSACAVAERAEQLAQTYLNGNADSEQIRGDAYKLWGDFTSLHKKNQNNIGPDRHIIFAVNKATRLLIEAVRATSTARGECGEAIARVLAACIVYKGAVLRSLEARTNAAT